MEGGYVASARYSRRPVVVFLCRKAACGVGVTGAVGVALAEAAVAGSSGGRARRGQEVRAGPGGQGAGREAGERAGRPAEILPRVIPWGRGPGAGLRAGPGVPEAGCELGAAECAGPEAG